MTNADHKPITAAPATDPLVTFDQLEAEFGIPFRRFSIQRMMRRGDFPVAIRVSAGPYGRIAWRRSQIVRWLDERRPAVEAPSKPDAA